MHRPSDTYLRSRSVPAAAVTCSLWVSQHVARPKPQASKSWAVVWTQMPNFTYQAKTRKATSKHFPSKGGCVHCASVPRAGARSVRGALSSLGVC